MTTDTWTGRPAPDPITARAPEVAADLAGITAALWNTAEPVLVDLVRRRIGTLLRDSAHSLAPPAGIEGPPAAKVAELADWPTSPRFDERDRVALSFTEQFVLDVAGTDPRDRADLAVQLGPAVLVFVQTLYALEALHRARLTLARLFGSSTVPAWATPAPPATVRPGQRTSPSDPASGSELWAAIERFMVSVARRGQLDAVTSELVRLEGARVHGCRLCRSRRSVPALAVVDDPSLFDLGPGIAGEPRYSPRQRAALALTTAMVTQPVGIDDRLVVVVRREFSPGEVVELVLDVVRNAANKIAVAFGADAPRVSAGVELFELDADGTVVCLPRG